MECNHLAVFPTAEPGGTGLYWALLSSPWQGEETAGKHKQSWRLLQKRVKLKELCKNPLHSVHGTFRLNILQNMLNPVFPVNVFLEYLCIVVMTSLWEELGRQHQGSREVLNGLGASNECPSHPANGRGNVVMWNRVVLSWKIFIRTCRCGLGRMQLIWQCWVCGKGTVIQQGLNYLVNCWRNGFSLCLLLDIFFQFS